jgi:hypothetical protein
MHFWAPTALTTLPILAGLKPRKPPEDVCSGRASFFL